MLELTIDANGFRHLSGLLKDFPQLIDDAAEQAALTVRNLVRGRTPVGPRKAGAGWRADPHAGLAKKSWTEVRRVSTGFSFGLDVPYANVLEYGGYTSVGPRTVAESGGIFSRQAPGGMITPVLGDPTALKKISALVASEITRGVRKHA